MSEHSAKGKRHVWRRVLLGVGVVLAVTVMAGAWIVYTGLQARDALVAAADAVSGTQNALLGADVAAAEASLIQAADLTAEAESKTSDIVWRAVGALPVVGVTPKAVTVTTEAANQVISESLPQFVQAAAILDVETIKNAEGKVDLARLPPASQALAGAQASLEQAAATLATVPTEGVASQVSEGAAELTAKVDEALAISTTASALLAVIPTMLGANGPQTYFVAFQSPVEIRGTGGFLGTYGLLTADQGELVRKDTFSNSTLQNFAAPVVDLGPDYRELYGRDPALWVNMNMSPNFPYAGVQWATAWRNQTGEEVAGVLAVDLTALQYLIQATGPVTAPDGQVLTADNVVQYLGSDIYLKYAEDNTARKDLQAEVATELIDRVLRLDGGMSALISALSQSVSGGHVQMWSTSDDIQQTLATTDLAGQTSTAPGPYVQLVLNNGGGTKLDYFLSRKVEYLGGQCSDDATRQSTVRVTLTNNAPPDLLRATSIVGSGDGNRDGQPDLINRVLTYVHFADGAGVAGVRQDGQPTQASFGAEMGRPVAYRKVDVAPGQPVTLEFDVVEPVSDAMPDVPVQPMVDSQETVVDWPGC